MTDAERDLLLFVARRLSGAAHPGGIAQTSITQLIAMVQYEKDCRLPRSFDMSVVASLCQGDA